MSNTSEVPDFLTKLGLVPPCTVEDVKQAYRTKVKSVHPDAGGTPAEFNSIQQAFEKAMEYAKFRAGRMAWLSGHVEQYAMQQALIGEIQERGGDVEIEQIDWLKRSFGADFAQLVERLAGVRLTGSRVDDEIIAHLASERHLLEGLHWLDLSNSRVTDRSVRMIASFHNLRRLDLRGTMVSERALDLVNTLTKLEWIGLPAQALGLWGRVRLHFNHRNLKLARAGEKCVGEGKAT